MKLSNCLQCNKPNISEETTGEYTFQVCEDGHRTGKLTKSQESALNARLSLETDENGTVLMRVKKSKKSKGVPMANMKDFDKVMGGSV